MLSDFLNVFQKKYRNVTDATIKGTLWDTVQNKYRRNFEDIPNGKKIILLKRNFAIFS